MRLKQPGPGNKVAFVAYQQLLPLPFGLIGNTEQPAWKATVVAIFPSDGRGFLKHVPNNPFVGRLAAVVITVTDQQSRDVADLAAATAETQFELVIGRV